MRHYATACINDIKDANIEALIIHVGGNSRQSDLHASFVRSALTGTNNYAKCHINAIATFVWAVEINFDKWSDNGSDPVSLLRIIGVLPDVTIYSCCL